MSNNNLMTRSFTTREKVLLVILTVLLIGGCYYLLVVKNVADTQLSNAQQMGEVQTEIQVQSSVVAARTQMAEALKKLGPTDKLPEVAVYDNLRNEIDVINTALAKTTTSSLSYGRLNSTALWCAGRSTSVSPWDRPPMQSRL